MGAGLRGGAGAGAGTSRDAGTTGLAGSEGGGRTRQAAIPAARRVALLSGFVAVALLGDSMLYAVLPSQAASLGIPLVAVGWALSANRLVRLVANLGVGWVFARLGTRLPFTAAMVLAAVTTATYGLAAAVGILLAARVFWGLSWSALRLGAYHAVLDHGDHHGRGHLMGLWAAVSRIGSLAGMVLGGILTDRIGFRPTLLLFGTATAAAAALCAAAGRPLFGAAEPRGAGAQAGPPAAVRQAEPAPLGRWGRRGGRDRQNPGGRSARWVGVLAMGAVIAFVVAGIVTSTLGLLLAQRVAGGAPGWALGVGIATLSGVVLSVRWLGDFLVSPLAGRWSDRRGRRFVLVVGVAGALGGLALMAAGRDLLSAIAGAALFFLAGNMASVVADASATDLSADEGLATGGMDPDRRRGAASRHLSWYATAVDAGAAAGPLAGYWLAERVGLEAAYAAGAGALLVALILYVATVRPLAASAATAPASPASPVPPASPRPD